MTSIQAASEREEVNLRDLEKAATPGPWRRFDGVGVFDEEGSMAVMRLDQADATFIAELRNAAPFLLDVVEAGRKWANEYDPNSRRGVPRYVNAALDSLDSHLSAASEREE